MDQIWWERVPNARRFIDDIVEAVLDEKSILVHAQKDIPWYLTFSMTIREFISQHNSSRRFETLRDISEPGKYLLDTFCKEEKRAAYRPGIGFARFLAESDDIVLNQLYIWVKIKEKKTLDSWQNFVGDYIQFRKNRRGGAVFILEWCGEAGPHGKKGIKAFDFDEYINEYDRMVFCMLAASSLQEQSFVKRYVTELVSSVVENDIELSAECLDDARLFLWNPYETIKRIVMTHDRSNGEGYSFDKSEAEVQRCIWLAQIKTIYPAIETYRENFTQRYANMLKRELPIFSGFGMMYTEPSEVELGPLKYMADSGQLTLPQPEYERLRQFKEARDKLSHLLPLSYDEILTLQL